MLSKRSKDPIISLPGLLLSLIILLTCATYSYGSAPAGYSEYYIPGDENIMGQVWADIGAAGPVALNAPRHTIISVVAWSPDTTIYYDHWENGYNFDPNNPDATADEKYVLANAGDSKIFESSNIPVNPRGTATFYDGRDRIYVAGGVVTVTRSSWDETDGTVFSLAWEVYPVKPQMVRYIMPFGDDLYGAPRNYLDFRRVFALIQATKDNTVVTFDFNKDGVFGDTVCISHNNPCTQTATQVTLNAGESFLLDRFAPFPTTGTVSLPTGAVIQGSDTLQVNYIVGDQTATFEARGFSAFPSGMWDKEYYAPVPSDAGLNFPTQLYLFNPQSSALTINYQTSTTSGSFSVPAGQTRSFSEMTGGYVPAGSGVYLKATDVFWGVSTIDTGGPTHEWGYPLVPSFLLGNEHFFGWAPGAYQTPIPAGDYDDSGIFITPVQDNTRVFVDRNNDGVADYTYTLSRLQTQYVYDATDGDMSNSHVWATGPIAIAYGQNPDTAPTGTPAIDLGYVSFPGGDFIDKVLTVQKSANPVVVATASGSQSTYTLVVNSYHFDVNGISVVDTLPTGWQYVSGSTTITLAGLTTISGAAANPTISGGNLILTWPSSMLGNMAPNQAITITFTAQTTQVFAVGAITRNVVQASGSRTVSGASQTFVASDFAFNTFGNLTVTKTSDAATPLYPGNQFTYTVTVTNPLATPITGVSILDPLPDGLSYVAGSAQVTPLCSFRDNFTTAVFTNNDGNCTWASAWTEINDDNNAGNGAVRITGGQLRFRGAGNTRPWGIQRSVDLSSAGSASIVFDGSQAGTGAGDTVTLDCSTNGTTWTNITSLIGAFTAFTGSSFAVPSVCFSNTTRIRLVVSAGYTSNSHYFYADNFHVDIQPNTPPEFLTKSVGYSLPAGQTLTLTYNVSVNNPLAGGIDQITNTAYINCNEIIFPLSASVTNLVLNPSSQSAEAGGRVWLDSNSNGAQDIGEPGLANVEVTLKDWLGASVMTTITDSTGHYLFTGIEPGNGYYVEVTPRTIPSGLQQSAPSGHTDNRTNTFSLTAGQSLTNANLGYKSAAGFAAIGNYAWSDANSNGTRDAGEAGLAGVSVELWLDNGDRIFNPATDTKVSTVTTAPDGSYLFTGVTANGTNDYFLRIDETQTKLSGYTRTAPSGNPLLIQDLSSGEVVLFANFGYHSASTYTITDRVWSDSNGNGVFNAGETGIPYVTVDLLDASLNAVANTTTDANGLFTFSGLTGGGADYTVRITDTGGKLANYYGTTTSAVTGSKQIVNLAGNVDYSSAPNFGYSLKRAIGYTVFNDMNGNGVQDAGEFGLSGITVTLYTTGYSVVATLTTDANGNYLFSGVSDGNYIVSIECVSGSPQAPLTGYTFTGTDSDAGRCGQQQAVTISGGVSVLTKNFPYRATTPRSVSGTLWQDSNDNGAIDSGEGGLAGVTIDLLQSSTVVATTATASDGTYIFNGLASGTYTIKITDAAGVLTGFSTSYEKTEGTTSPFNGQETVNLGGGNQSGVNFGYYSPAAPTLVVLSSFSAHELNGQVVVEWETTLENNTLGFYLQRLDPATGKYQSVTEGLLPGMLTSPNGGTYTLIDRDASPGGYYKYKLVEVEKSGNRIIYGPFSIVVGGGNAIGSQALKSSAATSAGVNASSSSDYTREPRGLSVSEKARLQSRDSFERSVKDPNTKQTGIRIKIPITDNGLYYVDANDISSMLGISYAKASDMIKNNQLSMSSQGKQVAYLPAQNNTGIFFYGVGTDNVYTRDNIYWIDSGKGTPMTNETGPKPVAVTGDETFTDTLHLEQDLIPNLGQFTDPEADLWAWTGIYLSPAYSDLPKELSFQVTGKADTQDMATLQLHLLGGSDTGMTPDHHVVVKLNDHQIGEGLWSGLDAYTLTASFSQSLIVEGNNTLEVAGLLDAGVPWSYDLIDSFDLQYKRLYNTDGDELVFRGDGNKSVSVGGFTSDTPDILVLDITNPQLPKLNTSAVVTGTTGDWQVSLTPVSPGALYISVAADAVTKVVNAEAVNPSNLQARSNAADYIVIAPSELASAAKPLADYRTSQGLKTMVINVDDIMNEFNFGLSSPDAIRKFLSYAYSNWKKAPQYVVLAGEGTWDYRDNLGFGWNLIPPALVPSLYGLATSDNSLADINGNHLPEMAIGRLPALTPKELQNAITNIKNVEKTKGNRIILLADNPDEAGDFTAESEGLAALFPYNYIREKVYLSEVSANTARTMLFNDLGIGAAFFNYIGHASPYQLSGQGVLTTDDMPLLPNAAGLPIVTAMTCSAGEFAIPGYSTLGSLLVLKDNGGAAAVWSSTGLSDDSEAKILNREFYKAVFTDKKKTLGDAVKQALAKYKLTGSLPFMTDIYGILGDPALKIRLR